MMTEANAEAIKTLKASAARLRRIASASADLETADEVDREAVLIEKQIAALESNRPALAA